MQKIILTLIILALATQARAFSSYVERESRKYGIPARIIYRLIDAESSGRAWIKHADIIIKYKGQKVKTNAIGLMGIVPEYHYKGCRYDLYDPEVNIKTGCRVLAEYIKKANGNYRLALKYYNSGVASNYWNWKYINKILKN